MESISGQVPSLRHTEPRSNFDGLEQSINDRESRVYKVSYLIELDEEHQPIKYLRINFKITIDDNWIGVTAEIFSTNNNQSHLIPLPT